MSKIVINKNNLLYRSSCMLEQYNDAHFSNGGFQLFDYIRIYNNGDFKIMGTNPEMLTTHYTEILKTPDDISCMSEILLDHPDQNKSFHFIAKSGLNCQIQQLFSQYQLDNVLDCIYRSDTYIDIFSYQCDKPIETAVNTYMNRLQHIEQFNRFFLQQSQSLLTQSDSDLIQFTPSIRQYVTSYFPNGSRNDTTIIWQQIAKQYGLSAREIECLSLIIKGFSSKQIAQQLKISHRTVECHSNKLRSKTRCQSRAQLIDRFNFLVTT